MKNKQKTSILLLSPKRIEQDIQFPISKLRRNFRDILNEINDTRIFSFKNCTIVDFVRKVASSPTVIYKSVEKMKNQDFFVFYYCGKGALIDGCEKLFIQNSHRNKKKSMLSVEKLESLITELIPINSNAIIIYEGDFSEFKLIGDIENEHLCKVIINHKEKEYPITTNTLFTTVFNIGMLAPKYSIANLLDFMSYKYKELCEYHYYGNLSILQKKLYSHTKIHHVWNLSPHNFSSNNAGSREDGIQEIKFALSNLSMRREALDLLEFLFATEKDPKVRKSIKRVLDSGATPKMFNPSSPLVAEFELPAIEWKKIDKGKFFIGSDPLKDKFSLKEEQPLHVLNLDTFYMAKIPVTVADWRNYIDSTGQFSVIEKINEDDLTPITGVNWYEAVQYGIWLTKECRQRNLISDNEEIRLPTEAEWEKASRGKDGRNFPWGDEFIQGYCNYRDEELGYVIPSGSYSPKGDSPFGVQDMIGNVWEWTLSNWGRRGTTPAYIYPYNPKDGREDVFASQAVRRIIRGGAYYYFDYCLRCCTRNLMYPDTRHSGGGFRLVKSKKKYFC